MIKQKQKLSTPGAYVAPACDALELSAQGVICQSNVLMSGGGEIIPPTEIDYGEF